MLRLLLLLLFVFNVDTVKFDDGFTLIDPRMDDDRLSPEEQEVIRNLNGKGGCNTDILFLLDLSGSIDTYAFLAYRRFLRKFTSEGLLKIGPNGHHIAIRTYSTKTRKPRVWDWGAIKTNDQYDQIVVTEIKPMNGLTHTKEAFELAYDMLQNRPDKNGRIAYMLHISDGRATDMPGALEVAAKIRAMPDTYIGSISTDDQTNYTALALMAGSMFRVAAPPKLFEKVRYRIDPLMHCERPTTTTSTTTTTTTTTPLVTGCELDLLFIWDRSSSVADVRDAYVNISERLTDTLIISPHHTQVAAVEYSSKTWHYVAFHFNKHRGKRGLLADLRSPRVINGGMTATGSALHFSQPEFENERFGVRSDAKHVAILFTDGKSQEPVIEAARTFREQGVELLVYSQTHYELQDLMHPNMTQLLELAESKRQVYTETEMLPMLFAHVKSYNSNCKGPMPDDEGNIDFDIKS